MNEERQILIHLHSNEIINEEVKIPASGSVEYGEIAIGYADGYEKMFIKNDSDEIVSFSCDDKFNESFRVISKAMCDLDDRILALENFSGITLTENNLIESKSALENVSSSGKVVDALVVKEISNDKEDVSNKVTSISSASTNTQYASAKCLYDIVGNIESLLASI